MYEGELVRLRALEPSDSGDFHRWYNDREVMRYMSPRSPFSQAMVAERLGEVPTKPTFEASRLAVEERATGRLIGLAALRDASPEVRDAEVDLLLGEKGVWGKGFGTDTMRTLCRYGFEQLNLHRIHLWVFTGNVAAVKVYEKVGFQHEALCRRGWYKDGQYLDAHLMGLLEGELR